MNNGDVVETISYDLSVTKKKKGCVGVGVGGRGIFVGDVIKWALARQQSRRVSCDINLQH